MGSREQAGQSGNGEWENKKMGTSQRLQPQIFKGIKNGK